jgi:hypothetical protein
MKALSIPVTLALLAAATANSPSQPRENTDSDPVLVRDSSNQDVEITDNATGPSDGPGNACPTVKFVNPTLTFGPTSTFYTATATTTETLDCGPCIAVKPSTLALGPGPVVFFTTAITAPQPSYTTEYVCATHAAAAAAARHVQEDLGGEDGWPNTMSTITPPGVAKPTCTSQTQLDPVIPDSTSTVYPSTSTVVSEIDCGGCAVAWDTGVVFFFAPVIQTATTTVATASTKVELACATAA